MIEIDEETVDKAIDDILGTDESVREAETQSVGGAQMAESEKPRRIYLNRCKGCGATFETPFVGGKLCPACKRKRISEGQKARQARERQERDASSVGAAIGRQNPDRPEENETHLYPTDELLAKWEALKEAEDTSSAPPAREPPERELEPGTMTADREDGAWGVLSALYSETRDVARTIGADTSDVIEALFRMNAAMDYMWRKRGERA